VRLLLASLLTAFALAACADETQPRGADEARYRADAFVLEDASHGPALCLGGVADSLPPQCGGIPLAGWDWDAVEGEDRASGARWGQFDVVGTYDGTTFTVLEAGPATDEGPRADPIEWTPCPEPEGGWTSPDPTIAGDTDVHIAQRAVQEQDDFAGLWVDTVDEGPSAGATILNIAFTGDLERHEADLREVWGGPLCLVEHARTSAELEAIQAELGDPAVAGELGLEVTWSATDVLDNAVTVGVVVADDRARAAVAERYGEGAVELFPALLPVAD
jgi:hypothetical protein